MDAKPLAPPIVDTSFSRPPWMNGTMAVAEAGWSGALDESLDVGRLGTLFVGHPDVELAEFPPGPSDDDIAAIIDEFTHRLVNTGRKRGVPPPPPLHRR
jgi:hypothetical protein